MRHQTKILWEKRNLEKQLFHGVYKPKKEISRKKQMRRITPINTEDAWLDYQEEKNEKGI
jgi:hypothetical protein